MKKPTQRPERVDQLLSRLGYGSRREVLAWVKQRRVTVDGQAVVDVSQRVIPSAAVQFDNVALEHTEGLLVRLHKPAGYVCSHADGEGMAVYDLLPRRWGRRRPALTSVGRLDKDTTGVLMLTDAGWLVQRWTSPHRKLPKTYVAWVDKDVGPEVPDLFASGTLILGGETKVCLPAQLKQLESSCYELVLYEGRFHQVKRMFAAVGCQVMKLHRSGFAGYKIDDLAPGAWEVLPVPDPTSLA